MEHKTINLKFTLLEDVYDNPVNHFENIIVPKKKNYGSYAYLSKSIDLIESCYLGSINSIAHAHEELDRIACSEAPVTISTCHLIIDASFKNFIGKSGEIISPRYQDISISSDEVSIRFRNTYQHIIKFDKYPITLARYRGASNPPKRESTVKRKLRMKFYDAVLRENYPDSITTVSEYYLHCSGSVGPNYTKQEHRVNRAFLLDFAYYYQDVLDFIDKLKSSSHDRQLHIMNPKFYNKRLIWEVFNSQEYRNLINFLSDFDTRFERFKVWAA